MLDLMRSEAGARRREWLDAMSEQTWARQQAEEERQKEEAKAMAKLAARLASPPLSPARSRMILNDKRVQSQNFDVHLGSMATFTVAEGACTAHGSSARGASRICASLSRSRPPMAFPCRRSIGSCAVRKSCVSRKLPLINVPL